MKLSEYIADDYAKYTNSFPEALTLSASIAGDFYALWDLGEKRGKEYGYLIKKNSNGEITIDKTKGPMGGEGSTSMQFKNQESADVVGNVHSHPAGSIGHVNGYCAHSIQDVRALDNLKEKPVFACFVASGWYVYAMVYRKGLSQLDLKKLGKMNDEVSNGQLELLLDKNKMTYDQLLQKQMEVSKTAGSHGDSNKLVDMFMLNLRKKTPGLGPAYQALSVQKCIEAAQVSKLGFYSGYRGFFSRLKKSEMKLELKS